jgi:hypothetical protein
MLLIFSLLSGLSIWLAVRGKGDSRVPIIVYYVSYGVTTVIGATIISIQHGGELWRLYGGGIDTSLLTDYDSFKYLFLLFSPLIVCPFLFLLFSHLQTPPFLSRPVSFLTSLDADPYSFTAVLLLLASYCVIAMFAHGFLRPSNLLQAQGDYVASIRLREQIFNAMGRTFFGFLYMGLPTLAHFALYKAVRRGSLVWRGLFLSVTALFSFLILLTFQKSILLLFVLSLAVGLAVVGRVRRWILFAASVIVFLLLNAIQIFVLGQWQALQGLYLIIFRMANSFPFYVNLYPKTLPYTGIDLGLDLFGLAPKTNEVEVVFNYMYPSVAWAQGAAPAPAHLAAYSQAGIWFAIVTLVIIGWYLSLVARLKRDTPVGYVLFIQGLVGAYYLTQITLRGFLITNYGLVWVLAPLLLLLGTAQLLKYATTNVREAHGELVSRRIP